MQNQKTEMGSQARREGKSGAAHAAGGPLPPTRASQHPNLGREGKHVVEPRLVDCLSSLVPVLAERPRYKKPFALEIVRSVAGFLCLGIYA